MKLWTKPVYLTCFACDTVMCTAVIRVCQNRMNWNSAVNSSRDFGGIHSPATPPTQTSPITINCTTSVNLIHPYRKLNKPGLLYVWCLLYFKGASHRISWRVYIVVDVSSGRFTTLHLVTHQCDVVTTFGVAGLCQHWCRQWVVACWEASYYQSQ